MALELVECPYCGFTFRIDIDKLIENGETNVVRGFFRFLKQKPRRLNKIDIKCHKCNKTFEHKVKT